MEKLEDCQGYKTACNTNKTFITLHYYAKLFYAVESLHVVMCIILYPYWTNL